MHDQNGHRSRLKNRFRKEGLDSFEEVHVLELLLFYAIPRIDTKPIARALLDQFGTFQAVMEGTEEQLMQVPGIGENAATFLRLVNAAGRYYQVRQNQAPIIINTIQDCAKYLMPHYYGRRVETVFLVMLDAKRRLLSCHKLEEGELNSANIPTRRIVELVLSTNATAVILSHNHPGGLALPSQEDIVATRKMAQLLNSLDVVLADHLVFANDQWISMRVSRFFTPLEGTRQYEFDYLP